MKLMADFDENDAPRTVLRGEGSRRGILDAAEDLFTERGFARTSLRDVAERARTGRGAILLHFKDKDGLAMAVAERAAGRLRAADHQPAASPLAGRISALLEHGDSALVLEVLVHVLSARSEVRRHHRDFLARRREGVEALLVRRRPAHVDPVAAAGRERAAAVALNGVLLGIHLQVLLDPESVDLEAALTSAVTMFDRNLDDVWR
ncbi:TetR family transcriptional regulator [Lentzea sp. NPDC060358]|uniref:TetR family transcriptional regulator n=1 Tax=Lentzea sp. NPDC060358 TaxID=3347103 RepID=UPI00365764F8